MNSHHIDHELEHLRTRAHAGDPHAVRELEERLSPALRRIVRRVLRLKRADTPLERGILSAAQRYTALWSENDPAGGNALVSTLAQRIWESIARPADVPARSAAPAGATVRWAAETDFA